MEHLSIMARNSKCQANEARAPMDMAKEQKNPHHFIVGAQEALPVDAAGNPWSGSYVHCNGNPVLVLLDNLVLESTGRLPKPWKPMAWIGINYSLMPCCLTDAVENLIVNFNSLTSFSYA